MRIAGPCSLPSFQGGLDMTMHLLSFFIRPDLVVVSLSGLPYVIMKSIDENKAAKCARLELTL